MTILSASKKRLVLTTEDKVPGVSTANSRVLHQHGHCHVTDRLENAPPGIVPALTKHPLRKTSSEACV